jgi:CMP-N-acetylneuraminic acid synthetase
LPRKDDREIKQAIEELTEDSSRQDIIVSITEVSAAAYRELQEMQKALRESQQEDLIIIASMPC